MALRPIPRLHLEPTPSTQHADSTLDPNRREWVMGGPGPGSKAACMSHTSRLTLEAYPSAHPSLARVSCSILSSLSSVQCHQQLLTLVHCDLVPHPSILVRLARLMPDTTVPTPPLTPLTLTPNPLTPNP